MSEMKTDKKRKPHSGVSSSAKVTEIEGGTEIEDCQHCWYHQGDGNAITCRCYSPCVNEKGKINSYDTSVSKLETQNCTLMSRVSEGFREQRLFFS